MRRFFHDRRRLFHHNEPLVFDGISIVDGRRCRRYRCRLWRCGYTRFE